MPRLSVACVMLQRVPPDIRILTPGFLFFSRRRVRWPRSAARRAATNPAAPAPMTITSQGASGSMRILPCPSPAPNGFLENLSGQLHGRNLALVGADFRREFL